MRHIILSLIGLLTLSGCCSPFFCGGGWEKKICAEEITDVVFRYGIELEEKYRLRLEHSFACYDEEVDVIRLFLSSQAIMELKEARRLIVMVTEGLLKRINENSFVRNEMRHKPFTSDDVNIVINFESFFGVYVDPLYIGYVTLYDGWINYFAFDYKDPVIDYWHCRSESYLKSKHLIIIEDEMTTPFYDAVDDPCSPHIGPIGSTERFSFPGEVPASCISIDDYAPKPCPCKRPKLGWGRKERFKVDECDELISRNSYWRQVYESRNGDGNNNIPGPGPSVYCPPFDDGSGNGNGNNMGNGDLNSIIYCPSCP